MRFIIVDSRTGHARSIGANGLVLGLAFAGLVALPASTGLLGYQFGVEDADEDSGEDLSKLSVAELKDRLKAKGLPVGGKKAELIERLSSQEEE